MKKASRYCISLLALCGLFLAGCDSAESSSDPASSSADPSSVIDSGSDDISSVEPSDPELSQAHIDAIAGDNITLSGTCYIGTAEYGTTDYETTVKYDDGYWQGSVESIGLDYTDDYENPVEYLYTETNTFYRTADGYVAESQAPDINNEVADIDSTLWSQSIFQNMLYAFEADWFEYDSSYSDANGYNKFVMTADALASDDVYYAEANLFSSIAEYTFGTTFGGDLQHFYIYTDAANENIVNIEFYEEDASWAEYGYTYLTNVSLDVSNIGSTVIDEAALYSPYSIPEGQEGQYAAFESAIAHLEEHNYTAHAECVDVNNPDHVYQVSDYQITENGYSGVDYTYEYTTVDSSSEEGDGTSSDSSDGDASGDSSAAEAEEVKTLVSAGYFGTYEAEDGRWDYYEGDSADALVGQSNAGSNPWYSLADHQFAVEIFELVEDESTAGSYVFQLREDYMDHNYAYYVAGEFTSDYFRYYMEEDYASGYNFKVTISDDGYIESFEFVYDDWTNVATFKQTFSDWGTTSISSDVADFTNYTAYEFPNFDNTYVTNYDDENYASMSVRDALVLMFGEDVGNAIPDFMTYNKNMAAKYEYSAFYPVSYGALQLSFDYYYINYDFYEAVDGFYEVAQALIDAGADIVEDDYYYEFDGTMLDGAVEVSVFMNSWYDITVEFDIPTTEEAV